MAKNNWFTIEPIIYPISFFVSLNQSDGVFINSFHSCYGDMLTDGVLLCHHDDQEWLAKTYLLPNNVVVMRFKDYRPCHRTLGHEIFHAGYKALDAMGFTLTDDSQEAYAYLIGFITEQFYIFQ